MMVQQSFSAAAHISAADLLPTPCAAVVACPIQSNVSFSALKGHLAPISSVDEVDVVMSKLLEDSKTASATHNILGYRVYDQSSGKVVQVS